MHCIYNYVPETNSVVTVHCIAAVLCLQFATHVMSPIKCFVLYYYYYYYYYYHHHDMNKIKIKVPTPDTVLPHQKVADPHSSGTLVVMYHIQ
jgi:hypothetical protein